MAAQGSNGSNGSSPPIPRRNDGRQRTLLTVTSIKHELADLIKKLRDGEIDPKKGNSLIYGLSKLADIIHESDFEQRLMRIERRVSGAAAEEETRQ